MTVAIRSGNSSDTVICVSDDAVMFWGVVQFSPKRDSSENCSSIACFIRV